ncbi:hypothetical protein GUJ93_ZPchr0007g3199 [Zizania palustris]|uniref:SKP1-like protein n=1 Tax=Zizania palustris TaxID=103762 RepID=A0A8J5STG1_ZIZPA|nr:hypothetical protein GUJ93_ZPchr0007g3199 [Zizania palustris]
MAEEKGEVAVEAEEKGEVAVEAAEKVEVAVEAEEEEEKDSGRMIHLMSSDQKPLVVSEKVARFSRTIEGMIEDGCADDIIPTPNADAKSLEKAFQYCQRLADFDDDKKRHKPNAEEEFKTWEENFLDEIETDLPLFFELVKTSNYFEINELLDITCQRIADKIKGKTPEEIRKVFNIVNDFSPEEEEEIRWENAWAFEFESTS